MSDAPIAGTFAILGATGAVGSTLARHLAGRGARLVLLARDEGRLADLAGPLGARTGLLPSCRPTAAKLNPAGRIGAPDDVARAMAFLLDPANSWLSGQVLGVDGGQGVLRPLA